ncbi:glycosyltransferase [Enterococcus casseliflavus]|nr:glycosyltransferase [Enterococcus casseliflavus]MBO1145874.1 glycosyltransferase [Enterococcus casseliflavus]
MNILHLLASRKLGGAEKVAINFMKYSGEDNNSFYCSPKGEIQEYLCENNLDYIELRSLSIIELDKIIKYFKIDIVHAHDFKSSILASFFSKKCKIVSHIHQSPKWIYTTNPRTMLYKTSVSRFSKILVTSKEIKNSKLFSKKNDVKIIDNFVEVPIVLKDEEKIYDFLFLGRLESEKNPLLFIDFIKRYQSEFSCRAAICGSGSLTDIIKKEIKEKNLNIEFFGFKKDPFDIINQSKFLVVTSVYEGFCLAAVESMSQGVPIITRRIGGVTDLVSNKESILTDNFISDEFIYRLKGIMDNQYNIYSSNAKKFSLRFTNDKKWRQIVGEIYNYDK